MQNLLRRGNTWFARLTIPRDRWDDVGRAMGASGGIKREVVKTLGTTDRREAGKRLRPALAAIQADIDAALRKAGRRPLTDWTADWAARAVELRAVLRAADDEPSYNVTELLLPDGTVVDAGESERDLLLDVARQEAHQLQTTAGRETALAFYKAVTTDHITLAEAADLWLAEEARKLKPKTIGGHKAVLRSLEEFLREKHGLRTLAATVFPDVTRKMAGEFIAWRASKVSAAAVKREFSAPMGLWRWAIRRGHTETNPWTDQTAGLGEVARGDDAADDTKRPFTTAELVTLLEATGDDWAPNGGGYGATLWDAVRLGLLTGLRASELANLRVRDLTEGGTTVVVRQGKTKSARRTLPLPKEAQAVLQVRLAALPDASADAPLWPELPVTGLTNSRGNKLSDRFRMARERLLPNAVNVDLHSLRRSYATALEAAMNAGGKVNPAIIATLMGHARGTMALDLYSSGAEMKALRKAVDDMVAKGLAPEVRKALAETMQQRPAMVRFAPSATVLSGAKPLRVGARAVKLPAPLERAATAPVDGGQEN